MKLSYNELSSILTFCDKNILIKVLPKTGKLRYYSSRMLSNHESICNSILDEREQTYSTLDIVSDVEIFEEFIDTIGLQDSKGFKNSIYYDKRLETIFTVNARDGSKFLLSKKAGKILLDKPYEYFSSKSISILVSLVILPWLQDRRHNFDNITNTQSIYISFVYSLIPVECGVEELEYRQLAAILTYLNTLFKYLNNSNRIQLPNRHKQIIRKMARFIILEK